MAAETTSTASSDAEYYDIVLVGRTGMGKSTTGNKLLGVEDQSVLKRFISRSPIRNLLGASPQISKRFIVADEKSETERIHSVTEKCELIANEKTKIRVLDVPGFADSGALKNTKEKYPNSEEDLTVFDMNLQIFRWVVRIQKNMELRFRRLVYFLPLRCPLEKADRVLQDELKVMTHFFGNEVFNNMVIVATLPPTKKYQQLGYDDEELLQNKRVLEEVLKIVTASPLKCPPMISIGVDDKGEETIKLIKEAKVVKNDGVLIPLLRFAKGVCSKCSVKYDANVCYINMSATDKKKTVPYKNTKCHPIFVPKYTMFEKVIGGVGHVATGGISLFFESWPGFTNSDEICPVCKRSPGSVGCCPVQSEIEVALGSDAKSVEKTTVDHTNEVS